MNPELFHFLRPWWLMAMLPLCLLLLLMWKTARNHSAWSSIVAPELLQHLLLDKGERGSRWSLAAVGLAGTLVIAALAGPTWERLPQPVYRSDAALVLVLDLSRSMDAGDIKPSRLIRARYKLADILEQRTEGQTALIVYAADAFTVTPLTDDTATIASQLPVLTTGLVPVQGSHTGRALELAVKLLEQAGQQQGDILLITDEVRQLDESLMAESPYRLSILGVGTAEGAPVPVGNGMLKDASGNIVIPVVDETHLRKLAAAGGGYYATLSLNDSDLDALKIISIDGQDDAPLREEDARTADLWREFGPWLLLLVLPLAALAFRRGILLAGLVVILPMPDQVQASMWQDLWYRADQQGQQLLQQDQPAKAAERFRDPAWRATARYRAGQYEQAADAYASLPGAEARYNQGNALAKGEKMQQAVEAYTQGLKLDPGHSDMRHNKRLLEDLLQQQQNQDQQNQDQQSQDQQSQDQQNQDQQNQDQQNQDQQSQDQQNQDQQNQDQQNQDQQNQDQQNQDQQNQDQQIQNHQNQNEQDQEQQEQQPSGQEQSQDEDQREKEQAAESVAEEAEDQPMDEEQMAREQWLKRIPDDPAGLLKNKFKYQYSRRHRAPTEQQQW